VRKKRLLTIASATFAVCLTATACGGSTSTTAASGNTFNEALSSIVNQSSSVGGTLNLEDSAGFDYLDPGRTYEEATEDLYRLFDRTMMTYKHAPGTTGLQVEDDLATSQVVSNDDQTWTYTIVPNAKFSNGDPITTKDIAYAIERSNFDATGAISGGPTYFANLLQDDNDYQGPYKDPNGQVSGILTPNATTITFNLVKPFADFPYLMTLLQTSPIEPSHDAGANYDTDISKDLFTGQYTVASYKPGASLDLVPNPGFTSASDPKGVHTRYASAIDINLTVNASTDDENLLTGASDLDIRGIGVSGATESVVLGDPTDRDNADSVLDGSSRSTTSTAVRRSSGPSTSARSRTSPAESWVAGRSPPRSCRRSTPATSSPTSTARPTSRATWTRRRRTSTPARSRRDPPSTRRSRSRRTTRSRARR
jgi:peptide/nickel transport system substrate-binding protein